ncbi:MAG: 2-dehydropantoate 2-reductase N-terminal domain-containing protein, partial [Candidatus Nanopelagicales bacterium]
MGMGSWGTAFGMVLADAGNDVMLCGRDAELTATINQAHHNPKFHPGIDLPVGLSATTDPREALEQADLVVLALPAQTLRPNLLQWQPLLSDDCRIVSLIKGLEIGTLSRMSEVIADVASVEPQRVAVMSGPNLAREIALKQPSASVVACVEPELAELIQRTSQTTYFRPYTNVDVVGVELGGV